MKMIREYLMKKIYLIINYQDTMKKITKVKFEKNNTLTQYALSTDSS